MLLTRHQVVGWSPWGICGILGTKGPSEVWATNSLGRWMPMLPSPCITFILSFLLWPFCSWAPWAMPRVGREWCWLMSPEWVILSTWSHFSVSIHIRYKYLTLFTLSEKSIHILLPRISLSPIFQSCSFKVPHHLAKPLAITRESL